MKFYCEHTKKIYDTMAECEAAEKAYLNEQNKKANAEKAAKDNLEKLYVSFQEANENVKKANSALSTASHELSKGVNEFSRTYGYVPDKYRSIQFLTWLL